MADDVEVPFPTDPECVIGRRPEPDDGPVQVGWLHFIEPKHGTRASLPITLGPTREQEIGPVWHAEFDDTTGTVTTSPSIHWPGAWHSGNPLRWRIVDRLADETETVGG